MTPRTQLAAMLAAVSLGCASAPPVSWSEVRPVELQVDTLPPGALVAANGREVGRAPLSVPLPPGGGELVIRATAPGFEPAELRLSGPQPDDTRLDLVLRPDGFGSQRTLAIGEPVGLAQAGLALLRADRPREALAFGQASLEAGDSPQGHRICGEAWRRLGERSKAIQELSVYLTMAPDAPDRREVEQVIAAARKDIPMTQPKTRPE